VDKKTTNSNKPKKFDTQGARQAVFVLAVTSTLGFWVYFSKTAQDQSANAESNDQVSGTVPPAQSDNQIVIELPPMPTLIPPLDTSTADLASPPAPAQNQVAVPQPSISSSGKILMGGARPSAPRTKTVTTTRSSR
jgi:hypothetical protein